MPITVLGSDQDIRLIENELRNIRELINASDKLPESKKNAILEVLDSAEWSITADLPFGGPLNGLTNKRAKKIRVSLNSFARGIERFRTVLFHELVHASCEGEFDAEVFECWLFPPVRRPEQPDDLPWGGTWPTPDDREPFTESTKPRGDGLRETEHFIWDPATGKVWKRNPDGSKGDLIWKKPDIWRLWICMHLPKTESMPGGRLGREEEIDFSEPGDYGYHPLDIKITHLDKY